MTAWVRAFSVMRDKAPYNNGASGVVKVEDSMLRPVSMWTVPINPTLNPAARSID